VSLSSPMVILMITSKGIIEVALRHIYDFNRCTTNIALYDQVSHGVIKLFGLNQDESEVFIKNVFDHIFVCIENPLITILHLLEKTFNDIYMMYCDEQRYAIQCSQMEMIKTFIHSEDPSIKFG
jgi:hypothetical protein